MIAIVFCVFLAGLLLALPICVCLGLACFVPNMINPSFAGNASYIASSLVSGLDTSTLLAVPMFILSGAIMTKGGIAKKLFDIVAYFIGNLTGGMLCAVVVTCFFYGAISGSGMATAAAVGAMTIPLLVQLGYDKVYIGAIVATASGLGIIIPPSIPMISYSLFTGVSVGSLFVGGVVPGCLIAAFLCLSIYIHCKRGGENKEKIHAHTKALRQIGLWKLLKSGIWALLTPVVILGSIYGGICTPTDAACLSVFYSLFVTAFIYKTLRPKDLLDLMRSAIETYASLLILVAFATAFSRILTLLGSANLLKEFIVSLHLNKYSFLLVLNITMLLLGMVLDAGVAICILSPLMLPIATSLGIDGVHFGVMLIVNIAIGNVTPPFGLNLFVTAPMIETPVAKLGKAVLIPIMFYIYALILITYIPEITLFLPRTM